MSFKLRTLGITHKHFTLEPSQSHPHLQLVLTCIYYLRNKNITPLCVFHLGKNQGHLSTNFNTYLQILNNIYIHL